MTCDLYLRGYDEKTKKHKVGVTNWTYWLQYLPNGSVQWLLPEPWTSSIGKCAQYHTGWKLGFAVEYTAQKTPQQNLHVETSFTVIAAQARSMLIAGQIPNTERFKLWPELVVTATNLNNLMSVTIGNVTKTCWEHAEYKVPSWTKNLCTFSEAGIMKDYRKE